jgi:hypothetical protein
MLYLETFFIIAIPFYYTMEFKQKKKTVFSLSTQKTLLYTHPAKENPVTSI